MLGGFVALAAAGWLIHATRAVSQAAAELGKGQSPPRTACGIAEIDAVLRSMARAARSLEQRSEAYQRAEAGRRESEARLRGLCRERLGLVLGNRSEPLVHLALRPYPSFLAKIRRPGLAAPAGNSHHLRITIPTSGVTTSRFWSGTALSQFPLYKEGRKSTRADGLDQRSAVL